MSLFSITSIVHKKEKENIHISHLSSIVKVAWKMTIFNHPFFRCAVTMATFNPQENSNLVNFEGGKIAHFSGALWKREWN